MQSKPASHRVKKIETAPPGTQNITEVLQGTGFVSIGNAGPFEVTLIYEGGGGATTVSCSVDTNPPQPLSPGTYDMPAKQDIQLSYQVDSANPIKLVWIYQ